MIKKSLIENLQNAVRLLQSGETDEAEQVCKRILRDAPRQASALHMLATINQRRGSTEEAIRLLTRAATFNPPDEFLLIDKAVALQSLGRHAEALRDFRAVLAISGDHPTAHYGLGNSYVQMANLSAALREFEAATKLAPNFAPAWTNRGGTLHLLTRDGEAVECYDKALAIEPRNVANWRNRGVSLAACQRHDEALQSYRRALHLQPDDPEMHYYIGSLLEEMNDYQAAISAYQSALAIDPLLAKARLALCTAQLPTLYQTVDEISQRRSAYSSELNSFVDFCSAALNSERVAAVIGLKQPFFLAYQGKTDVDLQSTYGAAVCSVFNRIERPPLQLPSPAAGERIKVGFVSGFFRDHSNWKIPIKGWIEQIDRSRFEVFGYYTGSKQDEATNLARTLCDRFVQGPKSVAEWRRTILDDGPHVLVYPEIGMDPVVPRLAAQRLAKVQCNSWGHPDTSGFPTLDYYISSDLMEPPDGDDHYTERLIRLPNLSIFYEPPYAPFENVSRASLGLRETAFVYWCGQSLFKYLPQFDDVFPKIAAQVSDCQFVFIEHAGVQHVTRQFNERLKTAFAARGLDALAHCVTLPHLSPAAFAGAISQTDIALDSIGWSGCNSTLETLARGIPIVTMRGDLMRGRHTSAIMLMMGVEETVASSVDDYVAIAVRLSRDSDWRKKMQAAIGIRKERLYRDLSCVRALESFLLKAVTEPLSLCLNSDEPP